MKDLSLCQHTHIFLALCITFLNHLYALVDKLYIRLLANVIVITNKTIFSILSFWLNKTDFVKIEFPLT